MFVVATKLDVLEDRRRLESLRRKAKRRGLPFFAISAVTGQGVKELLGAVAAAVLAPTETAPAAD
jgi:GTP-binding protein